MKPSTASAFRIIGSLLVIAGSQPASAEIVVVANRANGPIEFTVTSPGNEDQANRLAMGDVATFPTRSKIRLTCSVAVPAEYELEADSAHFFGIADDGTVSLRQIDFGADAHNVLPHETTHQQPLNQPLVIPVKILVDDEQPTVQAVWEKRLRQRVAAASAIFSRLFRVQFEVIETATWDSNDRTADLNQAIEEFSREVEPGRACLALGYTSQSYATRGTVHLGGIRGPLRQHLLLVESVGRVTEPERLEVLVHELGHYLGATHSPETNSVMRPMLGDRQARRRDFLITFDPVNALAVGLLADEIRYRGVSSFADVSAATRSHLRAIYEMVHCVLPLDPGVKQMVKLVRDSGPPVSNEMAPEVRERKQRQIANATRSILREIALAARKRADRAVADGAMPEDSPMVTGDNLTEYYVRRAALAAAQLEPDAAAPALLLALGIAICTSDALLDNPLYSDFVRGVENEQERLQRRQLMGQTTMRGRHDLAQHFFVSAFVTAQHGPRIADAAGVAKEILDSHGGSGFSFADLAANHAGIVFAVAVLERRLTLERLAAGFTTANFLPDITALPEGLTWAEFADQFGSPLDKRYVELRKRVHNSIVAQPVYRSHADEH